MNIKDNLKTANTQITPIKPNVTESDYFIHPKLKEDLEGIMMTWKNIEKFGRKMGNRNVLFTGPPGTGKTLGVQYIATRLEYPLYDGKSLSNPQQISTLYQQLRQQTQNGNKAILMLDEVDRFSSREEIVDPTQQQTLNQLLIEMDGLDSNHGIFVFGMTNQPNKIDSALRRTGRFSKEIESLPPDKDGRLNILKIHAYRKGDHQFNVQEDDLENAARVTYGYTGADLVGLLNEAFTHSMLNNRTKVSHDDFEHALKKTKPSALRDMPFREPNKKLKDLGGYDSHKEVLKRIINNSSGSLLLFYGPKGTGKTQFAEALAGEYGYNYMIISGSEPEDKFVGETGKKIDKYFERAKQLAPCVLLFDEIDSLVEKKGFVSHKSSWTGLLQSKLSRPIDGVYIIGTVNRPDLLNGTFIDRFVHKLYFRMPSPEEQEAIWRTYLPESIDTKVLVSKNDKLSCRDIARVCQSITDYGLKPAMEIYEHLIKDIQPTQEADYDEIRKSVGDSVGDYIHIKKFLK